MSGHAVQLVPIVQLFTDMTKKWLSTKASW